MRVRFWGVRGSVPWSTAGSIGHGCNTACLELTDQASGAVLVLDAGSGIVGVGEAMAGDPRSVPVLLTHYHWDHLQGLPFFAPLYRPGWTPVVWAPSLGGHDVAWVETIFQSPFFPVPFDRLPCPPAVRIVSPGEVPIEGFDVRALPLNHPGGALAYRIRGERGDLVYATDHELGDSRFDGPLAEFAGGARALVLDAHFTVEEGPSHRGWGHSTWAAATEFAASCRVERLYLFHHKPGRTDVELMEIEVEARKIFSATDAAGEGDLIEL